jgi:CheY-like chemotaxis protein
LIGRVSAYGDRNSAFQVLRTALPDLAIIDVGLGDEPEGGFTLCQDLRSLSKTLPIIFLTARDSGIDSVHGLRLGADDYVTKDMSMDHLLARVTALLRRADAWAEALKQPDEVVHRGLWPEQGKAEGLPQFIIFSSPDRQIVAPDRRFLVSLWLKKHAWWQLATISAHGSGDPVPQSGDPAMKK